MAIQILIPIAACLITLWLSKLYYKRKTAKFAAHKAEKARRFIEAVINEVSPEEYRTLMMNAQETDPKVLYDFGPTGRAIRIEDCDPEVVKIKRESAIAILTGMEDWYKDSF